MTATSTIPAAIDYLMATFTAAATLGAASPPVLVLDGPEFEDEAAELVLWVGVDNPDDDVPFGATGTQTWAGLGALAKNETFAIHCVIRAANGETVASCRTAAFAVLAAVETIVRADANLGGTILVTLDGIQNVRLRQVARPNGALAEVVFDIACKSRI